MEIQNIHRLDVEGQDIEDIKGLEYLVFVDYIDCSCNQLTSLDVSKNSNLIDIDCDEDVIIIR